MSESGNQEGWFSKLLNKIFPSEGGKNQRKRPYRSVEVEDEDSLSTQNIAISPKRMRSELSIQEINEPLSSSILYPSSANRSIDVRTKILQPLTRTQQILNELERLSSPKSNSFDKSPTYKSPLPPKTSLFTPTRLHEIYASYAHGTPKNYWTRPLAAKQDEPHSSVISKETPDTDDDIQIIEPSTSKSPTTDGIESSDTILGGLQPTSDQSTKDGLSQDQNDQALQPLAFSFRHPVERGPRKVAKPKGKNKIIAYYRRRKMMH